MKSSSENGFSLIEVLVSVFVLTVGVIGAASMQLSAMRTTQQSVLQTNALHLAAEMADTMRANINSMQAADQDNPYLRVDYHSARQTDGSSNGDCYGTNAYCDSKQLAQSDIAEWLRHLNAVLPGARVRICRDDQPWSAAEQNFRWNCSDASITNASIVIKIGWHNKHPDETSPQGNSGAPGIALTVAPYGQ